MRTHVILLGVTPDDLYEWLHECIDLAHQELAIHPLRPQPEAMIPYQVPLQYLYRFARELATSYVGIYEALPETSPPFGVPLLLLGCLRTPSTRPAEVPIGIWRHRRFPLELSEIAWELEKRFPYAPAPASPLQEFAHPADLPLALMHPADLSLAQMHPAVLPLAQKLVHGAPSAACPAQPPSLLSSAAPHLPDHGRRASPNNLLPSTQWLADQIAALPDPVDPEPLYQDWLAHYEAHVGQMPRDSARSFEKALDSAFKQVGRLRRRRQ